MRFKKNILTIVLVAILFLTGSSNAFSSGTRLFKYSLNNIYESPMYKGEIDSETNEGRYFQIKYDSLGREKNSVIFLYGEKLYSTGYRYRENSEYCYEYINFDVNGEPIIREILDRDKKDRVIKKSSCTVDGEYTHYTNYIYHSDMREYNTFNTDGSYYSSGESYFDYSGVIYKIITHGKHMGTNTKTIYHYDPNTGLEKKIDRYVDDKYFGSAKNIYDDFGVLIRREGLNKDKKITGYQEFNNGLLDRTYNALYDALWVYEYDTRRQETSAKFYFQKRFICWFIFERYENGEIKRTIAKDLYGNLMAVYPNRFVTNVLKSGIASDGKVSITYTKEDWY